MSDPWQRCSICKKELPFESKYFVCNVSTCNRKRTGLMFCSMTCWEAHLPTMRHREAWAEERKAPTRAEWAAEQKGDSKPSAPQQSTATASSKPIRRRVVESRQAPLPAGPREILIVASRLKNYVKERSGMSTSDSVMDELSDHVRRVCERAMKNATDDGRKTVLDRDLAFLKRLL